MLTDAAALALAWVAFRIARRPADAKRSYGYHRGQVLAAFVNGAVLIVIVAGIAVQGVQRLIVPVAVAGWTMLAVAGLALVVNLAALLILQGGYRSNLNLRGPTVDVLGDLLGPAPAVIGAVSTLRTGWLPI